MMQATGNRAPCRPSGRESKMGQNRVAKDRDSTGRWTEQRLRRFRWPKPGERMAD
jgi:hypothetical protein